MTFSQKKFSFHLSYYPPDLVDEHVIFHRLLSMFHPRPFLITRFPPQGMIGVVRARYGSILDIFFRFVSTFFIA